MPYTVEEAQPLLEVANRQRNAARWVIALALGLRQGEVLGLTWTDVDFDLGVLIVHRGRLRPRYQHGCGDPCGRSDEQARERSLARDLWVEKGIVVSTASYWAVFGCLVNETRCRAGRRERQCLRPVIMERSLKVIDEELQVAGADVPPPSGARGNGCR